ncbi:MAG: glycosyltransferase [Ignavibacteria bacterium]|nr:glycosyltransferase [Ignavibacteria bacterium]
MLICIWNLYLLRRRNYPAIPDTALPFISVLVPARNEEHNIRAILSSLLKQDYPNYEVIVLNDSSDDKTPEIISEIKRTNPQLKVINGLPLEPGWTGKCFACNQLFNASKGEYILFTDADTVHNPNSLRDSLTIALNRKADMLTLFPKMQMITLAEKIIMPMLWFTVMMLLPFYFVDKKGYAKFSIGIGPFMMFKRSAYELIGCHAKVKNAIVEDVWLGRKIKEMGLQLIAADGQDMLSVRMYRNFKEIWDGFSKNIFAGFQFSSLSLFMVNSLYFLLFFLPFLLFFIELSLQSGFNYLLILTGLQVLILYFTRTIISARFKLGIVSTVLHPLGAISVPVIAINSWRWISSGAGAKWKGRVYNPVNKKV